MEIYQKRKMGVKNWKQMKHLNMKMKLLKILNKIVNPYLKI